METSLCTLADAVDVLDRMFPPDTALTGDVVGLTVGDPSAPVRSVLLAVDPTLAVIDEAVAGGHDLLVTHHHLLRSGLHAVVPTEPKGAAVLALAGGGVGLYSAHTNADVARGGVNDALAAAIGLQHVEPLSEPEGQPLGRVGQLPGETTLEEFAHQLAGMLPGAPVGLRVAGPREGRVERVAVLGGSGDREFEAVRAAGADVLVTADLRHHPVSEFREHGLLAARSGGPDGPFLVDAGHWATESLWLRDAGQRMVDEVRAATGARITAMVSSTVTDPWDFVVDTQEG
ncbi:Nif3-like dinuclear metal center hexameric protein [Kytococcus sedentarius]|uniref:Nif3-like dinuclear metal center hexameric protein n=1 Tax=Kytococcus sedentarius TaxID=1276 RepID=UPI0035BC893E